MPRCLTACLIVLAGSLAAGTAEDALQTEPDPTKLLQSADPAQRFAAKTRIVQERRSLVRSLVMIVRRDPHETRTKRAQLLRLTSPKCLAIELLGELRAEEAISTLVRDLTYYVDTSIAGTLGGRGLGARYPAAASLAKIGNPAVPRLLQFLGTRADPLGRHLCVWTLIRIEGRDVGRLRLQKAIKDCGPHSTGKANLEAALEYFDNEDLDFPPPEQSENTEDK